MSYYFFTSIITGKIIGLLPVRSLMNTLSSKIYVDGLRVGDIGSVVIKDRKIMSNDGVLVTILNINLDKRQLMIN
mgnify:CR=1 FL=1